MKVIKSYLTKNRCYQIGEKMRVKGVMIHSVGCAVPRAMNFVTSWNRGNLYVCVHAFVEDGGDVYQTLPWDIKGWHCGKGRLGSANKTHIGIEMTEPACLVYSKGHLVSLGDREKAKAHVMNTYHHTAILTATLCQNYGLDPMGDGVVISHSEGHHRGIASNHGDVEHLWNHYGLTMTEFRKEVRDIMNGKKEDHQYVTAILKEQQMKIDDQVENMTVLNYQGYNYIKVRDLEKVGAKILFNKGENMPIIYTR